MRYAMVARLVFCFFLLCSAGLLNLVQAQSDGPEGRIKIRFTSEPDRARFRFAFGDQQVSGTTTATKIFTYEDDFDITVVFSKIGFKNCQKKFKVVWLNENEGTLTVEGEQQQRFNFSAAASPAVVNCDLERSP